MQQGHILIIPIIHWQQPKEDFMDYKKLYFHLFNAVTDALQAMEQQNYGQASTILISAQQETEEMYLEEEGE